MIRMLSCVRRILSVSACARVMKFSIRIASISGSRVFTLTIFVVHSQWKPQVQKSTSFFMFVPRLNALSFAVRIELKCDICCTKKPRCMVCCRLGRQVPDNRRRQCWRRGISPFREFCRCALDGSGPSCDPSWSGGRKFVHRLQSIAFNLQTCEFQSTLRLALTWMT